MTHPTHGLDPNALVGRLRHLVSLNDPERGGPYQGAAATACVDAMREAADLLTALSQNPGTSNTSGEAVAISVKTMKLSDGREDHYVSIRVGDREITPHKYSIKGRAEFDVAEWNWLLNGAEKPDVVDWLDRTRPLAALEPRASDRERTIEECANVLSTMRSNYGDLVKRDEAAVAIRKLSEVSHEH